jgi:probable phosphoglycerate mutase
MKVTVNWLIGLCLFMGISQSYAADVTIYLTRHGKTMFNTVHRAQGWADETALMKSYGEGKTTLAEMIDAIAAADSSGIAERYNTVAERMERSILSIARAAHGDEQRNVLVVSHGLAIGMLLEKLGYTELKKPLENASVTKIRYTDEGKLIVESVGDMSYVEQGRAQEKR